MNRTSLTRRLCALLLVAVPCVTAACADPSRTISLNAYRNAVATGAADVLAARGVALRERPDCRTPGARNASTGGGFGVHCTASTRDGDRATVRGLVRGLGTTHRTERYEISVAGTVVATTTCLGASCPQP